MVPEEREIGETGYPLTGNIWEVSTIGRRPRQRELNAPLRIELRKRGFLFTLLARGNSVGSW